MFKNEFNNLTPKKIFIILIFGFLTVNFLGIGLTSFLLSSSKASNIKDVSISNKNFSDLLSNNISKAFEKTELLFESLNNYINLNDISLADEFLDSQANYYKDLENLTILDINGNVQYSNNKSINKSFNKEQFFINTLNSNKLSISNYNLNNHNVLLFSQKIIKQNKVIGVVFATFNTNNFNYLFNSINIGHFGSIVLSDKNLNTILVYNFKDDTILTNHLKEKLKSYIYKFLITPNNKIAFYDIKFENNDYLFSSKRISSN